MDASRSRRWPVALLADVVLVIVFAGIGLIAHEGGIGLAALARTAWPFLAALAAGWLVCLAWRRPAAPIRTGLPVWAITVVAGMLLRVIAGDGTAVAFVIVAAVTLALFLVGWRAVAGLVGRARRRTARA